VAEGGGLLNRCRAFKVLPRVRIPPSPPAFAQREGCLAEAVGAQADQSPYGICLMILTAIAAGLALSDALVPISVVISSAGIHDGRVTPASRRAGGLVAYETPSKVRRTSGTGQTCSPFTYADSDAMIHVNVAPA
jgi:hypothetical protein